MYRVPERSYDTSLILSDVLDEIGVNENVVLKTRRQGLICESLRTITYRLKGDNMTMYCFGSQTEGSTTIGIDSDADHLLCIENFKVITDAKDWTPGFNLLMIQDRSTSPGYCLLQIMDMNKPLLLNNERIGRLLFKNNFMEMALLEDRTRQGPSIAIPGQLGFCDQDYVYALRCKSWPKEARKWLSEKGAGKWPTEEVKSFAVDNGCFLVPVCSKRSAYKDSEWRISTSQAERALMFSLNITQLRCYVLMKMILKTFINPKFGGAITSYICKTVVFHCIKNADPHIWQKHRLVTCLTLCLSVLQYCIITENCPHFIINENNLILDRISKEVKHKLLDMFRIMILSNGYFLTDIKQDDLGFRFLNKMEENPMKAELLLSDSSQEQVIAGKLLRITAQILTDFHENLLSGLRNTSPNNAIRLTRSYIKTLYYWCRTNNRTERTGCMLMITSLCSTLGAMLASRDNFSQACLSDVAIKWLSAGLHSDVSSGRLKLASAYYCAGDIPKTNQVLDDVWRRYDRNVVEPVCACYNCKRTPERRGYRVFAQCHDEDALKHVLAFCVMFSRHEINSVPKELQYEMFRTTMYEYSQRNVNNSWMDMAVIDSYIYLLFLRYKTNRRLGVDTEKDALSDFIKGAVKEPNLRHKETAMNIIGQCFEKNGQVNAALTCYMKSLSMRPAINAAKVLICRLLSNIINN